MNWAGHPALFLLPFVCYNTQNGKQLIVSPYALVWNNGNYYLYAYDGKKFRYYRVDRMERISFPLLQKREGKEAYTEKNITSQKAKVFDMYGGRVFIHADFTLQNRPHPFTEKCEKGCGLTFSGTKQKPLKTQGFQGFGAAAQI